MSGNKKDAFMKEIAVKFLRRIRKVFKSKSVKKLGYNKLISDEEQRFNLLNGFNRIFDRCLF